MAHEYLAGSSAPAQEATLWGRIQDALGKIRSAREVLGQLESRVKAGDKSQAQALSEARARLARLEKAYREVLRPALGYLAEGMRYARRLTSGSAVVFKNRELEAVLDREHPEVAQRLRKEPFMNPREKGYDPIKLLKQERERSFSLAVKAEGMLAKAGKRLERPPASPSLPGSLPWILDGAQAALSGVSESGRKLAAELRELDSKECAEIIAATGEFIEETGRGGFNQERRDKTAHLIDDAEKKYAIFEYNTSSDIREVIVFGELLNSDKAAL